LTTYVTSISCILNGLSVNGYNGEYLPDQPDIQDSLRALVININQTNYHFVIEVRNSYFYDIDQAVMSINSFSIASNTTVLLENCLFENIRPSQQLSFGIPMIEIQVISIGTRVSVLNCAFQHVARWRCTLTINLSLFNLGFVPFHSIPSFYKSKRDAVKVLIHTCKFLNNRNPILLVTGHVTKTDHDTIKLGPIEVQSVIGGKDYAMHIIFMTVFM